jgi:hypothetical protein
MQILTSDVTTPGGGIITDSFSQVTAAEALAFLALRMDAVNT